MVVDHFINLTCFMLEIGTFKLLGTRDHFCFYGVLFLQSNVLPMLEQLF